MGIVSSTRECAQGSVIHSDEWPAYSTLKSLGFVHSTVNHQDNYVNPASGTHTQGIEHSWLDAKIKILRKMRGTNELLLQSHLNEYCYRVMRKHSLNLFIDFLNDIKRVFVESVRSATCNTVDHKLTGRSYIGRAPMLSYMFIK
jgi:hypothetical protein